MGEILTARRVQRRGQARGQETRINGRSATVPFFKGLYEAALYQGLCEGVRAGQGKTLSESFKRAHNPRKTKAMLGAKLPLPLWTVK